MRRRVFQLTSYAVALLVLALAGQTLRLPAQAPHLPAIPSLSAPESVLAPIYPEHRQSGTSTRTAAPAATAPAATASPPTTPTGSTPLASSGGAAPSPSDIGPPSRPAPGGSGTPAPQTPPPSASTAQFQAVVNGSCADCRVTQSSNGTIEATVPSSNSANDSAYALLDFGGSGGVGGPVYVQDRIALGAGQTPTADLQVLQVLDTSHRIVYRLVISAGTRVLRIQSPPGSLASGPIDVSTGTIVPNDGSSSVLVQVGVQPGKLLTVSVNGRPVVHMTQLDGGEVGGQRYLAAGVVATAADPASSDSGPVSVSHARVAVSAVGSKSPSSPPATPPPTPTLASSPPVKVVAPSAVTPPAITGAPVVGGVLQADPGTWSDTSARLTLVWQRCDGKPAVCTAVAGASGQTYTLTDGDAGSSLRLSVTAANSAGSGSAVSPLTAAVTQPQPDAPQLVSLPVISGRARVGSTLTAASGTWNNATSFAYAWQRCSSDGSCTPIDGATDSTYQLTPDDLAATIQVVVTATGAGGSTSAASAATDAVAALPAPTNATAPTISGDTTVGSTLTATTGDWNDATSFAYTWQSCDASGTCTPIDGATGNTLALTDALVGQTVTVTVTATNTTGSTSATSTPTAAVSTPPPPAPPPPPPPPADSGTTSDQAPSPASDSSGSTSSRASSGSRPPASGSRTGTRPGADTTTTANPSSASGSATLTDTGVTVTASVPSAPGSTTTVTVHASLPQPAAPSGGDEASP